MTPHALRAPLLDLCAAEGVRGTLLLAREGINGTISGSYDGITRVLDHLRGLPGCADLTWKDSQSATPPFGRMKVRLKREIVTMGVPMSIRARHRSLRRPAEWNDLIRAPDVAVIDTRNAYEVAIGSFEGAIDPGTDSFRDFPAWWRANGIGSTTSAWRCSAPVGFGAKNQRITSSERGWTMSITSRAAS